MRLRISAMISCAHDVLVQRVAAQVEEAVFQADVFRIVRLAEHRQRQFLGRRQHFDLAGEELDLAGRQFGLLTVSGVRAFTSPSTRITHSPRTVSAVLKAGESGSTTICVMP
jgi:hypothetical protein